VPVTRPDESAESWKPMPELLLVAMWPESDEFAESRMASVRGLFGQLWRVPAWVVELPADWPEVSLVPSAFSR